MRSQEASDKIHRIGDNMEDEFIVLFLGWTQEAPHDRIRRWLADRQLETLPMKAGLAITGLRSQIEKVFCVSLENKEPPVELPVPEELQPHVLSVRWPRPRTYHP